MTTTHSNKHKMARPVRSRPYCDFSSTDCMLNVCLKDRSKSEFSSQVSSGESKDKISLSGKGLIDFGRSGQSFRLPGRGVGTGMCGNCCGSVATQW